MDTKLTPNGERTLAYMQENDDLHVGKDLGEALSIAGIYPVLNSLIKRGLVMQGEPAIRPFTNNKGVTKDKEYKTYHLTDAGRDYNIE